MAHFRFLDLPPEMRNTVYDLSLHHNRVQGFVATPALLRTCSQIYKEAKGILYAEESTFTITAKIRFRTLIHPNRAWNSPYSGVRLGGDMSYQSDHADELSLMDLYDNFPPQILQFPTVHLDLQLPSELPMNLPWVADGAHAFAANRLVYALVHRLNSDGKPRRFELVVKRGSANDSSVREATWPLSKLHPRITIENLTGTVDEPTATIIDTALKDCQAKLPIHASDPFSDYKLQDQRRSILEKNGKDYRPGTTYHLGCSRLRNFVLAASISRNWTLSITKEEDVSLCTQLAVARALLTNKKNHRLTTTKKAPEWLLECYEMALTRLPKDVAMDVVATEVGVHLGGLLKWAVKKREDGILD